MRSAFGLFRPIDGERMVKLDAAFSQCRWTLRSDVTRMAAMSAREEPSPVNNRRVRARPCRFG
jgi:hypothetical protein